MHAALALFVLPLLFSASSVALRAPLSRHTAKRYEWPSNTNFLSSASNPNGIPLRNTLDNIYSATITLGGQEFAVQVDTGSSDLWIKGSSLKSTRITSTTKVPANITYGKGTVAGPVSFADLTLGGFTVRSQAFINAQQMADLEGLGDLDGLIGLGFHEGSAISAALIQSFGNTQKTIASGFSPTENVFYQNPTTPNFFTFLLGRQQDLDGETSGIFTISEYIPEYSAVSKSQKVPRELNLDPLHWSVLLDGFSVNGRPYTLKSQVPSIPAGRALVALDTGFSLPPIPEPMVDFIYSSIPGALKYTDPDPANSLWIVPCRAAARVAFDIGGQEVPIHPLDLTMVTNYTIGGRFVTFCTNRYTPIGNLKAGRLDMVLGDAFLRNVYVSFDYGTLDSRGALTETPFVQILPTTQFNEALPEFTAVREKLLRSMPEELPPAEFMKLLAAEEAATSSASSAGPGTSDAPPAEAPDAAVLSSGNLESDISNFDSDPAANALNKYAPVVIGLLGANVFIVLILCILAVYFLMTRSKNAAKSRVVTPDYRPLKLERFEGQDHRRGFSGQYDG
ncbi:hypothetical protein HGRIS_000107 [Hohenbuehelia grisea]|uniref:Peptidase A1 domain-containing protein n=1 Tax=Hohenbuehelia grisea TaxID=104357 RepID=A0ABR3JS69_9AGAR